MALFEIFTHMKALSESMILPAGSNVQPPVLETGWDQKSLLHHQSHIVRIMGCWWDYTFELRNDLLLTNKMRSINIALFESLVKLARGPDQTGSAPELWATFSLPDKNNPDVMLPMILT
jgi:hypothetical protein